MLKHQGSFLSDTWLQMHSTPKIGSGERKKEVERRTRKRTTVSPIKQGQDYGVILRRQEISASPALKKIRNGKPQRVGAESEEGVETEEDMPKTGETFEDPMDEGDQEEEGLPPAQAGAQPSFTFHDFTSYMDKIVANQFVPIRQNVEQLDNKIGMLNDTVGRNGMKLYDLEKRIWHML